MPAEIAVAFSAADDGVAAVSDAAAKVRRALGPAPELSAVFAGAPHLGRAQTLLDAVAEQLEPAALIGCGAGGVIGPGVEAEQGPGAVVWGLRAPGARASVHHLTGPPGTPPEELEGLPGGEVGAGGLIAVADPYTFAADALLERLNSDRPGIPVIGGLASAAVAGASALFCGHEVVREGAVLCALTGVEMLACVSQGATPVGPEMTITGARDHVITELASKPAVERLGEVIGALEGEQRALASSGPLIGIVIDENRPEHERGDFLVRPLIGADADSGAIAVGERVRVGQTVRLHVRDATTADIDLRSALGAQAAALGDEGAAGALVFSCNGRGSAMFDVADHDALAIADTLGAPSAGFFAAGEIGPVAGRSFLHGFTATIAVFPAG